MALRGTLTHRKTRRLARLLRVNQCFALGVVEALWHVTAEQKPTGAIGQMSNQDIADEMFYTGDADRLVSALCDSGFIDQCEHNRLVVHDWGRHADQATKRKVTRHGESIVQAGQPCLVMTSLPGPVPVPESCTRELPPNPRKRGHESISNRRPTRREKQRAAEADIAANRAKLDAERLRQAEVAANAARKEWTEALKLWGGLSPSEQQERIESLMKQKRWQIAGVDLAREFAIRSMRATKGDA